MISNAALGETAGTGHVLANDPQPLLFDSASLPESPSLRPRRTRGRRTVAAAAEGVAADTIREAPSIPLPVLPPRVIIQREPFDPASLTNPELRALVQALPDARLAHLIGEAAREIKQRLLGGGDDEMTEGPAEPNPLLLRAARAAVGELSGEDV